MAQYVRPPRSSASGSAFWGVPGRYSKSVAVTGNFFATGSQVGAAAVIVASGATGNINLPEGGSIPAASIAGLGIQEIGVESIDTVSGTIYVLYRNHSDI